MNQKETIASTEGNLQSKLQEHFNEEISTLTLKGSGLCNDAYYLETKDGKKYLVKLEKEIQEFEPENSLVVEAEVAKELYSANLNVPIPKVVFISNNPDMYGYEYIEGDMLKNTLGSLSEEERISIFKQLGIFHAQIGQNVSKETAEKIGVTVDESTDSHPETLQEYASIIEDETLPEEFTVLVKKAKSLLDSTTNESVFQFIHNDAHHENIIIKDNQISGIIDFGNSEYGETAKEFSRYIRDFPDYFEHIVSSYEETSGNKLSRKRLISNACVSGFIDIVENYKSTGERKIKAESMIRTYQRLLKDFT